MRAIVVVEYIQERMSWQFAIGCVVMILVFDVIF